MSKRSRGYDNSDVAPKRRLRRNIADLFLASDVSGQRARSLLEDADAAGASGVAALRNLEDDRHRSQELGTAFAADER